MGLLALAALSIWGVVTIRKRLLQQHIDSLILEWEGCRRREEQQVGTADREHEGSVQPVLTFVVTGETPSALVRSLTSVQNQNTRAWQALVVMRVAKLGARGGVEVSATAPAHLLLPLNQYSDKRITYLLTSQHMSPTDVLSLAFEHAQSKLIALIVNGGQVAPEYAFALLAEYQ